MCGLEKDESEFNKNRAQASGLSAYCRDCLKIRYQRDKAKIAERNKRYREANPNKRKEYYESHREQISAYSKQWWIKNREKGTEYNAMRCKQSREFLWTLKEPCVKCGEERKCSIDFHHIDPSKKSFALSSVSHKSEEAVRLEKEKCVCLCKNCHSEFHFIYGRQPSEPIKALEEYLGKRFDNV
jgi:hypothetical protein